MKIVITTCPAGKEQDLVLPILEEHLAACAQVLPSLISTFRWEGCLQQAQEASIWFKTADDRVSSLMARLSELHPYEVPEIACLDVLEVLPSYASWLNDTTRASLPE